jgi:hypothetical protein
VEGSVAEVTPSTVAVTCTLPGWCGGVFAVHRVLDAQTTSIARSRPKLIGRSRPRRSWL